jgi:prefoldin subunit 5
MKISPRERVYLIEFLNKEAEQLQKAREESNKNIQKKIEEIKSSKRTIAKR